MKRRDFLKYIPAVASIPLIGKLAKLTGRKPDIPKHRDCFELAEHPRNMSFPVLCSTTKCTWIDKVQIDEKPNTPMKIINLSNHSTKIAVDGETYLIPANKSIIITEPITHSSVYSVTIERNTKIRIEYL
jgi:hypothetical protein